MGEGKEADLETARNWDIMQPEQGLSQSWRTLMLDGPNSWPSLGLGSQTFYVTALTSHLMQAATSDECDLRQG